MGSLHNFKTKTVESVDAVVDFESDAVAVIEFLNERAGRRFPARLGNGEISKSARMVLRLLREGHAVEDIRSVIAMKCRDWRARPHMAEYLRPKTLFGPENFEQYVGQLEA